MEEFLTLLLTGERKRAFLKFRIFDCAAAVIQLVLAVIALVILTYFDETVAVAVGSALTALIASAGAAGIGLLVKKQELYYNLLAAQRESDRVELTGEQLAVRESFYEKFFTVFTPESKIKTTLPRAAWSLLFVISGIFSALTVAGLLGDTPYVSVFTVFAGIIILIMSAALSGNQKKRMEIYDAADAEITKIKVAAGISNYKIDSDRNLAGGSATKIQEIFLCDASDKKELREVARFVAKFTSILVAALVAVIICFSFITKLTDSEEIFFAAAGCMFVVVFAAVVAIAIIAERRRKIIYLRNAAKLTSSPEDEIRAQLQTAFVKTQRLGNIIFVAVIAGVTLSGLLYGGISALILPDTNLWQNALGAAGLAFFVSIIIALVVWVVIYARYRLRVRPLEKTLKERTFEKQG